MSRLFVILLVNINVHFIFSELQQPITLMYTIYYATDRSIISCNMRGQIILGKVNVFTVCV